MRMFFDRLGRYAAGNTRSGGRQSDHRDGVWVRFRLSLTWLRYKSRSWPMGNRLQRHCRGNSEQMTAVFARLDELGIAGADRQTSGLSLYDSNRKFIRNHASGLGGTTRDDAWEEYALPFVVPDEAAYVACQAFKGPSPQPGGIVWADDFYLGEGLGLADPPTPKRRFEGTRVRVDELGNFEVNNDGDWKPFFPLCMYSDNQRDWSVYSKQGWNTIIWTAAAHQVAHARAATSEFNPDGMMAGFQFSQYTFPGKTFNDLDHLRSRLTEIANQGLSDNLLLYYWDNEVNHDQWEVPANVIGAIRKFETQRFGESQRPLYALQGTFNNARVHAARGLVDVSGTYFGGTPDSNGAANKTFEAFTILDRQFGQCSPASFAQFNDVNEAGEMRLRLYNSLIVGARAMGYWRDCYQACDDKFSRSVGPVDEKPWWSDFPNLRREIDAILPLIRQPHWVKWRFKVSGNQKVHVGARDHNGRAHLILVNQTTSPQTFEVQVSGLPYQPTEVWDVINDQRIATITDGGFQVSLEGIGIGRGTKVVQLR